MAKKKGKSKSDSVTPKKGGSTSSKIEDTSIADKSTEFFCASPAMQKQKTSQSSAMIASSGLTTSVVSSQTCNCLSSLTARTQFSGCVRHV